MSTIFHLETLVPEYCFIQQETKEKMLELHSSREAKKYIQSIYQDSGIAKRYSVLSKVSSHTSCKNTKQKNEIYIEESKKLVSRVVRNTFNNCSNVQPHQVTDIITVSCTGFYAPGIDVQIINEFGLADTVARYHLGFMGCFGAFPALKMADQICRVNPQANVLIVCLELCTLHMQIKEDLDTILANSLFADGVAVAIVNNKEEKDTPFYQISNFNSHLIRQGEEDMAWTIGDFGFDMVLSKYIPKIIAENIRASIELDLTKKSLDLNSITKWAIHPGGKSIIDKVQQSLSLSASQVEASRYVLSNFGNMSSASVLFVLQKILADFASSERSQKLEEKVCAMAFGPGLTLETATLTLIK